VPENAESSAASYAAARQVVGGLALYSSTIAPVVAKDTNLGTMPEVQAFNDDVQKFVSTTTVPVTVCPATCLNMGSFYGKSS
jgi:hypothetical protein